MIIVFTGSITGENNKSFSVSTFVLPLAIFFYEVVT